MTSIGHRLRTERLRLGLNQEEFAAVGRVGRRTQAAYEAGERVPDASYLLAVSNIGVDIHFVLRGDRLPIFTEEGCTDEAELVALYRQLNHAGRAALRAFAAASVATRMDSIQAEPTRAKRLVENRRAALDQRTAEHVEQAMADSECARAERAARMPK
ncbi:helix-turn-helix transcriptional regulator [Burkholderia gladioli pv. alliicola]|uniref:helix-turn-helix domain-containing protein n=1 Tax=Burkholderia gladioli TaxID=28095 RepID=UPI002AB87C5E|nr:helix-turn-helix transcriptional regulator [Burkholderia gladioli]MDZ4036170.1 helix-turn-helix transcriptional regulator [Burkholderia gladioli pv. alliicola]